MLNSELIEILDVIYSFEDGISKEELISELEISPIDIEMYLSHLIALNIIKLEDGMYVPSTDYDDAIERL